MRKNSAPADSKGRVGELQRRAQDARKRAEAAKKEARDAKQRAREARQLFKEAKKVAKKARNELVALSEKLKKLIDREPRAKAVAATLAAAKATKAQNKSKSKPKGKADSAKPKRTKPPKTKLNTVTESAAADSPPRATPRTSRSSRKSVANGSVEAVVDTTTAGEAPARTSEESVDATDQNTPEESAA